MLAICSPHPNWMPMNPKLMFQIWTKVSLGLVISGPGHPIRETSRIVRGPTPDPHTPADCMWDGGRGAWRRVAARRLDRRAGLPRMGTPSGWFAGRDAVRVGRRLRDRGGRPHAHGLGD